MKTKILHPRLKNDEVPQIGQIKNQTLREQFKRGQFKEIRKKGKKEISQKDIPEVSLLCMVVWAAKTLETLSREKRSELPSLFAWLG